MDILGSWIDSAKQKAQNAIKDKLESGSVASGQILLNMLHDAFTELPAEQRKELFQVLESLFVQYRSQEVFDFEAIWQEVLKKAAIQDLASSVSKRLVKNLINKVKQP
jgi:hypothetical protein